MKREDSKDIHKPCFVAFIFDTEKIDECFYGNVVVKNIIEGKEIVENSHKIVFSMGDILEKSIYEDISPLVIKDNLCTINGKEKIYRSTLFAVTLEDVEEKVAIAIDKRLKENFSAYIGMTSINVESRDERKQFWKWLIRKFSIEERTITIFGLKEEGFEFYQIAEELDFCINYDGFPDEFECENKTNLFSTRQSSFIQNIKQLKFSDGKNDADRGILEMNYSLVREVELAGVQIWKAIEDINFVYIPKEKEEYVVIDYLFTSLYEAAQGIERLLKIIVELIAYENQDDVEKERINNLLYGHNHPALFEYVSQKENVSLNSNGKKLLNTLASFYSNARYNRFSFSRNSILELELFRDFGSNIKDYSDEKIKHLYGKTLGQIAQTFYELINQLSGRLHIFVYELNSKSVANFSLTGYWGSDLYEILKQIEQSKKELIWYIMKNGNNPATTQIGNEISPLAFEACDAVHYLHTLITNEDSCYELYNFVSESYDELIKRGKKEWEERIDSVDALVGNEYIIWDGVESLDE